MSLRNRVCISERTTPRSGFLESAQSFISVSFGGATKLSGETPELNGIGIGAGMLGTIGAPGTLTSLQKPVIS